MADRAVCAGRQGPVAAERHQAAAGQNRAGVASCALFIVRLHYPFGALPQRVADRYLVSNVGVVGITFHNVRYRSSATANERYTSYFARKRFTRWLHYSCGHAARAVLF